MVFHPESPKTLTPTPNGASSSTVKPEDLLDMRKLMSRVDNDLELLGDMIDLFLRDLSRSLTRIQDAIRQRDAEALAHSAHALKGAVGAFSADKAFEAAYTLEKIGRTGTLNEAELAWGLLATEIDRLTVVLTELKQRS